MPATAIRLREDRVRANRKPATALIDYTRLPAGDADAAPAFRNPSSRAPRSRFSSAAQGPNLKMVLATLDPDDDLLDARMQAVLVDTRDAVAIGIAASDEFGAMLGYDDLKERALRDASASAEFAAVQRGCALVAAGLAAAWIGSRHPSTGASDAFDADEPRLETTEAALGWAVAQMVRAVDGASPATLDERAGAAARAMTARLEAAFPSLAEPVARRVENAGWSSDERDFTVHGLRADTGAKSSIPIARMDPDRIVGNEVAKREGLRLARMLAAYDPERGRNPFLDAGGMPLAVMGDGLPGTGKTEVLKMVAGETAHLCDVAGLSFTFASLGVEDVSEMQGRTAKNAKAFVDAVMDPSGVGLGAIDDVDQVAGRRDDERASNGQQDITAVLMQALAGAGTVLRGNCTFIMLSNHPDKVDDALRQRAGQRWTIDGPRTPDQYAAILAIHLGDLAGEIARGREIEGDVGPREEEAGTDPRLAELRARHRERPFDLATLGAYLHDIAALDPRFSGRSIKNIGDALRLAVMDVDLPDEWFETREPFLAQPYERKVEMIRALRRPLTEAMVWEAIDRFAGSELRYSARTDETEIEEFVRRQHLLAEATRRIETGRA